MQWMGETERNALVDWALLGPPLRRVRELRRRYRKRTLYSSPPTHSELCGKEAAFSEQIVAVIAFNRADVIEWQIHLVRKYLAELDGYIVFDNSTRADKRDAIRELCRREKIPYVGLPANPFKLSASHGAAMNWVSKNFIAKHRPKIFGFLDHDIFPTKPFSVREQLQGKSLYGFRLDYPSGWHLWPAFAFSIARSMRRRWISCRSTNTAWTAAVLTGQSYFER